MKRSLLFAIIALFGFFAQAQVTYTVTVPAGTNACFIAGGMNGWTHQEMTLIAPNTYSITIQNATTAHLYKYSSGPNWGFVEKQANCTSDIPDRIYSPNDVVACWAAVWVPDAPKFDITVRVKLPVSWTTPRIHFWGDQSSTWPGMPMVQDGEWWTYTFNQISIINIIFNNNGSPQTTNITNVTSSTCYQVFDNNSFQVISCEPAPVLGLTYNVTVPAGTNHTYIAGDMTSWNFVEMTMVTPTTYTIHFPNATASDKYKYLSGPNWAFVEKQVDCTSDIPDRTHSANDVVACWAAVWSSTILPQDYVYNVTVPEGTAKCFIAGNFNNWSEFVEMTKLTPTTFTITINTATPNGFKFSNGPSWNYEEVQSDGAPVTDRTYNVENTVAMWKNIFVPTVSSYSANNVRTWVSSTQSGLYVEHDGRATAKIFSLQGSMIQQIQFENSTHINNLAKGVYVVRINGNNFKAIVQ